MQDDRPPSGAKGPPEKPTARVVDFVTEQEPFAKYLLADGTEVKFKMVMTEFRRVDGVWNQDGTPAYEYSFVPVMRVTAGRGTKMGEKE